MRSDITQRAAQLEQVRRARGARSRTSNLEMPRVVFKTLDLPNKFDINVISDLRGKPMSDSHNTMTSSQERKAWSTSGYLILVAFLALLALTIYRIIAFAGTQIGRASCRERVYSSV